MIIFMLILAIAVGAGIYMAINYYENKQDTTASTPPSPGTLSPDAQALVDKMRAELEAKAKQ